MIRALFAIILLVGCTGYNEAYAKEKSEKRKECTEETCKVEEKVLESKSKEIQVQQMEIRGRLEKILDREKVKPE